MAARFWVGGTGTWDATTTANWSATSGGAGGASVPGAADDVTINTASITVTTNYNVSVISVTINASAATLSLGGTLTCSGAITLTQGTFTTNNFNVTASSLSSSNSNTRTINLGSSTVTLTTDVTFTTSTNLTFNAGTSAITATANAVNINGGSGVTFYNYTRSNTTQSGALTINGNNVFNNLTIAAPSSAQVGGVVLGGNQTINGTLTFSASSNATIRRFVRSDTIGTTRTLTCAAVASLTDIDFRDITIAGAAAPVSGTRLGDCKGNSGITFDAAKTVYYATTGGGNWGATNAWSFTSGGAADPAAFPLSQDTVIVESAKPNTGSTVTINAAYNIGTIDMSARTSNTMTLATSTQSPTIYGNWINGTGTTLTGTGTLTFAGRGSQTITSAGRTFTQTFVIQTPNGSVTLQDAFSSNRDNGAAFTILAGTFDASGYNTTFSGASSGFRLDQGGTATRGFLLGSGTLTVAGTGGFNASVATGVTVTGTGTISLTSASAKTFAGGGIQTYPTLNQGGIGTLTVSGSNKFAGLTNTAIGRIQFTGGTTNIFNAFNISGVLGNLLQLGSTNTTQAILQKGSAWLMGANSTDAGNNTNLSFTAGGGIDYLSVSYINGQVVAGGYTITATNGTYAVAGQAATLLRSRLITSSTGYYNVDGYPATIVIGGSPIIVTDQLLIKLRSFTEIRRF